MSIRYKIALLFLLIVTILFAIVSLSVYLFSVKERSNTFKTRLKNRALSTARIYVTAGDKNFAVLRRLDAAAVASLYNKSVTVVGFNNAHEYMFSDKPGDSLYITRDIVEKAKKEDEYFFTYNDKAAVAIHYYDNDDNFIVAVAATDLDGREYLGQLKKVLFLSLVFAVALSFSAALLFARNLVNPIKKIAEQADLITANNFSQRIKIGNANDELGRLAQTFNNLLDRLQDSFAIQRRFISNASHELSTPLTSISSQIEVALQKKRNSDEYQEVLQSVYEDIRELHLLTHSLLDIAKAGTQGSIDLNEVRLDEILFKAMSDVQKQNEGFRTEIKFDIFPDDEKLFTVFGNANLLYIAFRNIIENGCKYSDNNESMVTVLFEPKAVTVKVANQGDVIAEADIQNIFQPFFRTDTAQQKKGFGLGLTLTRRIIVLHKGIIDVTSDTQNGTVFTIQLPNILAQI